MRKATNYRSGDSTCKGDAGIPAVQFSVVNDCVHTYVESVENTHADFIFIALLPLGHKVHSRII